MAKRGRKPSAKRKGYFYEEQEEAFKNYLSAATQDEKDEIFNTMLLTAFTKMTESIIRRYNLYIPDEEFEQTFKDAMSFLITKIEKFNPEKGYKAYSYCGTIIKNYLIYKINQFAKNQKRSASYDGYDNEEMLGITDALKYSYNNSATDIEFLTELMKKNAKEINDMVENAEKYRLNENQIKVGKALVELLTNWEDIFSQMGSNKFNKSSILLFLKECTLMNTKEIRDSMRVFKNQYYDIKKAMIDE